MGFDAEMEMDFPKRRLARSMVAQTGELRRVCETGRCRMATKMCCLPDTGSGGASCGVAGGVRTGTHRPLQRRVAGLRSGPSASICFEGGLACGSDP